MQRIKVSNLLSASQDLSSYSGKFRGRQKQSDMRAQEAVSLIDETLNFFVKTTGKDEASMRHRLTGQNREELRRNRDHWKARAEDEERFQKMKEEAWRLFERQPGFKRKTRNEFEEEFGRKIRNVMGKGVQKWSNEMQRAIQPEERRREARERTTMEQEDSNSQRQRTWGKLRGPRIPVPSPQPHVAQHSRTWGKRERLLQHLQSRTSDMQRRMSLSPSLGKDCPSTCSHLSFMPVLRVATARDLTSARINRNVVGSSCLKWDLRGLFECSVDVFLSAFVFSCSKLRIRSWCTSSLCQSRVVGIIWLKWRGRFVGLFHEMHIAVCFWMKSVRSPFLGVFAKGLPWLWLVDFTRANC